MIFGHNIYDTCLIVRYYLKTIDVVTVGRFGEWDYLWNDQTLLCGLGSEKWR